MPTGADAILVIAGLRSNLSTPAVTNATIAIAGVNAKGITGIGVAANRINTYIFLASHLATIGTGSKAVTCTMPGESPLPNFVLLVDRSAPVHTHDLRYRAG